MVIAMFLAHLVGDFILQWDALAEWKLRQMRGVIFHCLIILLITTIFALPFEPFWWQGVLFISVFHFLIDTLWFYYRPRYLPALARFTIDQLLHFLIILVALVMGGFLTWNNLWGGITASAAQTPMLTTLLGYAFITMPAWVLLKFAVYGLVKRQPPNFPAGPNKYVGIVERLLITTLIIFGQVLLVPLVTLPRLLMEWPRVTEGGGDTVYIAEFISSITLAVMVGIGLRFLPYL
ncbi:MAG: DUF3307 domain-containing protein [Chloroflexota bacterium]|jgi:hypothetical protein